MGTTGRFWGYLVVVWLTMAGWGCSQGTTPGADGGPDAAALDGARRDTAAHDRGIGLEATVPDVRIGDAAGPDLAAAGDLFVPQAGTVGAPCTITGAGGQSKMINPYSAECQTTGCLYYGVGVGSPQPLCTRICAADADCPPASTTCPGGFGCGVPFVTTSLACCKMCICRDYLPGGTPPNPSYCASMTPSCPP